MQEADDPLDAADRPGPHDPDRLLHQRLLAGDVGRLESLYKQFADPIGRRLTARPRFRRIDPQRVADAVLDALIDYNARPDRFDPGRGRGLVDYLTFTAGRDLLNLTRSETRRHRHEERAARERSAKEKSVELSSPPGNVLKEEAAAGLKAMREKALSLLADPLDRQVFELQLAGEKRTSAFAAVLGLTELPADEQKRRVKRVKDRIAKILRRGTGHD